MSLVIVPIYVEDPAAEKCNFDYIEVYRSQTKWGVYTKISTNATRLDLCSTQNFYDFTDENGSEYHWYKWNMAGPNGAASIFSKPIQAHTPDMTYCKLDDIRRLLRTKDYQSTIRMSDSYKNLRKRDSSQSISLAAISVSQDYSGFEEYEVKFDDPTNFTVYVGSESAIEKRIIGQGTVGSDFTSNDNNIKIYSSDWSGVAVAGDSILFETDSHVSTIDVIRFSNDAEVLVDVILEENLAYSDAKEGELRFERENVPKAVSAATARFAAFLIYTTIYSEQSIPGLPNNLNDITMASLKRDEDLSSWSKQAMRYLNGYVTKYKEFFDPETGEAIATSPRWIAMDTLFDAVGVVGVGEGLKIPDKDVFFERTNQSYEGLLDWDLLIPAIDVYMSGDLT